MSDKDLFFIQYHDKVNNLPVEEFYVDHGLLIKCVQTLIEKWQTDNTQIPFWMEVVSDLVFRITSLSTSFQNSVEGNIWGKHIFPNPPIQPDLSTISIIARAQLEAYLVFFYLYIQPASEEEHKMRFYIYVISGLLLRVDVTTHDTTSEQKKRAEKARIDEYVIELSHNELFNAYEKKRRNQFLTVDNTIPPYGRIPAKVKNWATLIEECRMDTSLFNKTWDLASNHAHAEYVGLFQMRDFARHVSNRAWLIKHMMTKSLMLLSYLVKDIVSFANLDEFYDREIEVSVRYCIDYWEMTGRNITAEN